MLQDPQHPKLQLSMQLLNLSKKCFLQKYQYPQTLLKKEGRGEYASLFEAQTETVQQLSWHEGGVCAFKTCAAETVHPSGPAKKDQPSLWIGSYLKSGKSSQMRSTFFKPEGASITFQSARINANFTDLSVQDVHSYC